MKIIKIENSYNLGDRFSNVTLEGAWKDLISYFEQNKDMVNKLSFYKDQNTIILQSLDYNSLISIIDKIDPKDFFKKKLIKNIKLNLKFNKETKELELDNSLNDKFDDINTINYFISYDHDLKNDVYFSEDSLLINYENVTDEEIINLEYKIGIIFFIKTKIIKDSNNEIISENNTNEYILIPYNKNTNKLKFINFEILNKENENFNLSLFVSKFNNNESIDQEIFNVETDLKLYKFSDIKLAKTLISINEPTEDAILRFKNSLNKYIFDNFINLEKERNAEEIK